MKILHIITNTELGGAQKVCIDLCCSASQEGHDVAVASMEGGYLWGQLPSNVKHYYLNNLVKPIKPLKDLKVIFELLKVKKDFKPEKFAIYHPGGALGRRLLTRVKDLMHISIPKVKEEYSLKKFNETIEFLFQFLR